MCTPNVPSAWCVRGRWIAWRGEGTMGLFPQKSRRSASGHRRRGCDSSEGGYFLARRAGDGLLGGLWEPVFGECAEDEAPEQAIAQGDARALGAQGGVFTPVGRWLLRLQSSATACHRVVATEPIMRMRDPATATRIFDGWGSRVGRPLHVNTKTSLRFLREEGVGEGMSTYRS